LRLIVIARGRVLLPTDADIRALTLPAWNR